MEVGMLMHLEPSAGDCWQVLNPRDVLGTTEVVRASLLIGLEAGSLGT